MTKTFTQNDLIRYYYKETSEKETKEIQNALVCNPSLQEQFKEISLTIRELDNVQLDPSDKSVNAILEYSKSLHLHLLNR